MIVTQNNFKMGYIGPRFAFESGTTPALSPPGALVDDEALWNGSMFIPRQRTQRRVTGAHQTTSSTTFEDISNLVVSINRGGFYTFEFYILYVSSATSEGAAFRVTYDAAVAGADYMINMFTDASNQAPIVYANSFGSAVAPQAAGPGPSVVAIAHISGSFNALETGVLSPQVRAESGGANTVTVRIGSWARVYAQ